MRLSDACPKCFNRLKLDESLRLMVSATDYHPLKSYRCGHIFVEDLISPKTVDYIQSINTGKVARPYQIEGVQFYFDSGNNCIIADEMGVGKTAQAALAIRNNKSLLPCLTIVKSSLTWQWLAQDREWFSNNVMSNYIIMDKKGFIPPGMENYIISMDTFSRMVSFKEGVNPVTGAKVEIPVISSNLALLGIKSIIVDEAHSFKDPSSMRTRALVGFVQASKLEGKLFLTGTPVMNKADEFFVLFNLVRPTMFPSKEEFQKRWLIPNSKGKYTRIAPWLQDEFREMTKAFMIRRERKDVQKDLPEFQRNFEIFQADDQHMKDIYNMELDRLAKMRDEKGGDLSFIEISDSLMTLRRITGMMKVKWCVEEVADFIENVEIEKIAIGVHHHMVRDAIIGQLSMKFGKENVLSLSGDDDAFQKNKVINQFQQWDNRLLVISMEAGGTGIDGLQVCNNVLGIERMWSSAKEEQFEGRFHRGGQLLKVNCKYPVIKGTIDEWWFNMVEEKRFIFGKAVSNDYDLVKEPIMWNDLVDQTLNGRLY